MSLDTNKSSPYKKLLAFPNVGALLLDSGFKDTDWWPMDELRAQTDKD